MCISVLARTNKLFLTDFALVLKVIFVKLQGGPKVGLQLFWRGLRNVARLKEDVLSTYDIKLC